MTPIWQADFRTCNASPGAAAPGDFILFPPPFSPPAESFPICRELLFFEYGCDKMKKRVGISPCHFNTAVAVCCTGGSGAYVSHTITSDASFRRIVI